MMAGSGSKPTGIPTLKEMVEKSYPLAREGIEAAEEPSSGSGEGMEVVPLARLVLPAVGNCRVAVTRLERRFAALRCVEAIRLYAAAHDGRLPEFLDEVTEVPIPGKPFPYRLEGDTAVLEAAGPDTSHPRRYRLTLAE